MGTSTSTVEDIRVAAERGDANAQNELGFLLYKGNGVPKDCPAALQWYLKAAKQGHAPAQNNLGFLLKHGGEGVVWTVPLLYSGT